jgi:MoaA/NifB/PqqE/SkfB family radical SAM enzyme
MTILGKIADQGIAANICTNGTLLTSERVRALAETSLRSVSISLDGSNAAEHDLIRGRAGAFDATIEGIRLLRENLPAVAVNLNCTLTRGNFRNLPSILRMAGRLGCRKVNLAPFHTNLQHRSRPKENFSDLLFDRNELQLLAKELVKGRVLAKELGLRLSSSTFLDNIPRFYTEPERWHQCYAGYASCAISPWGDVSPCADLDSALNIRDRPLDEIWRSPEFQALRNQVDKCPGPCWDTTNAEIAIRFSWPGLFGELRTMRQDLRAYSAKR